MSSKVFFRNADTLPSEKVVALSLSKTYIHFLTDSAKHAIFKKFLRDRSDIHLLYGGSIDEKLAS